MSPLVQLPGGQLRDEIRNPVYDSEIIGAGISPIGVRRFFSAVQGKARYLTNLRQNNLLETAVSYRVQGMSVDCQNFNDANRAALPLIVEHSSISVRVGEKVYYEAPWTMLSGRLEQNGAVSTTVVAATEARLYQKFGQSAVAPVVLTGKHVIDILPLQSFAAQWDCEGMTAAEILASTPAAGTKLQFYFSFKGLLRRPVQ
jgi:hypothetical protein